VVSLAQAALGRLGDDAPSLASVIEFTKALVDLNWPAITRVADELAQRREMDWDDFVEFAMLVAGG
jgi:hypothetical protein